MEITSNLKSIYSSQTQRGAFSSKQRALPTRLMLYIVLATPIFGYNVANAGIGEVRVDGEVIDPALFSAYQSVILPDPDYCFPDTDTFVVDKVLERILIRNAAKTRNIDRDSQIDEMEDSFEQELKKLPDSASQYERDSLIISILSMQSDGYASTLLKSEENFKPKEAFLNMLAANDPLVVNVTELRTAMLRFNTLDSANEVLRRLQANEDIDNIANELGQSNYLYTDHKEQWRHPAAFPSLPDTNIVTDSVLGPHYNNRSWEIHKVLETKILPVALYDDRIDDRYNTVSTVILKNHAAANRKKIVNSLREAANVEIDGKPSPRAADLDHCVESLY